MWSSGDAASARIVWRSESHDNPIVLRKSNIRYIQPAELAMHNRLSARCVARAHCLPRLRFLYGIHHKVIQCPAFDGQLKTQLVADRFND